MVSSCNIIQNFIYWKVSKTNSVDFPSCNAFSKRGRIKSVVLLKNESLGTVSRNAILSAERTFHSHPQDQGSYDNHKYHNINSYSNENHHRSNHRKVRKRRYETNMLLVVIILLLQHHHSQKEKKN